MTEKQSYNTMLACPDCKSGLEPVPSGGWMCGTCAFRAEAGHPVNLMPVRPQPTVLHTDTLRLDPGVALLAVDLSEPQDIYNGPKAGWHDDAMQRLLLSVVMSTPAQSAPRLVLDLGCGGGKRECFESIGCNYVSVDLPGHQSDIFCDAHHLPFRDAQFDVVFSFCVLEHLRNPFLALREVCRVLKPGGIFVGMCAQGEPFHNSYFNCTAWGLLALGEATELKVTRLWGHCDTVRTLSQMGNYPRAIRLLLGAVDLLHEKAPFLAPRRMLGVTKRQRQLDRLHAAGSICFCMSPA